MGTPIPAAVPPMAPDTPAEPGPVVATVPPTPAPPALEAPAVPPVPPTPAGKPTTTASIGKGKPAATRPTPQNAAPAGATGNPAGVRPGKTAPTAVATVTYVGPHRDYTDAQGVRWLHPVLGKSKNHAVHPNKHVRHFMHEADAEPYKTETDSNPESPSFGKLMFKVTPYKPPTA